MHFKKVTKTVDYYSYVLSGEARSRRREARRPQPAALGRRSPRAESEPGPLERTPTGVCEGHGPREGPAHFPTESGEGGRERLKGRAGEDAGAGRALP